MIYLTNDGALFAAEDAGQLVRLLRSASRAPSADEAAFMRGVADRTEVLFGTRVNTASFDAFVAGLLDLGLITEQGE